MNRFSTVVYASRLSRAAELAERNHLDGFVFGTGAELAYLTGSWMSSHERFTGLVVPARSKGLPTFIAPSVDRGDIARSAIPELGIDVQAWEDGEDAHALVAAALPAAQRVGLGSSLTTAHVLGLQHRLHAETVLATPFLAELFMRKDAEEIEQLRAAAAAIDEVHAAVPQLLTPGTTERAVAEELERLILSTGHSGVDFVIVGSGENGANAHHDFSERELTLGDPVVVDIGGTWGPGYHSDCTRTYIVGGPESLDNREFGELYAVLERAQRAAVDAVRPGIEAQEIDRIARSIIDEAGYAAQFVHRTGHGIGLSTHEEPFIMSGNSLILEPGMAFSIEPGIYLEGRFGARIEDIVVVTDTGVEVLNNNPRSLQ